MTLQTNAKYPFLGFSYEKIRVRRRTKKKTTSQKPYSSMEFQAHLQKYTVNIKHIKTDFLTGFSTQNIRSCIITKSRKIFILIMNEICEDNEEPSVHRNFHVCPAELFYLTRKFQKKSTYLWQGG